MMLRPISRTGVPRWCWLALIPALLVAGGARTYGQTEVLIEDYEFCTSDEACGAGVIDKTDIENQPALYIHGADENASPQEGFFSIGTDAVFCLNWQVPCVSGTFIGFRVLTNGERFPSTCSQGGHYVPLEHTYGDPAQPGSIPPDFELSQLSVLWDAYGDGAFADGLTGSHLWLRLVDCEGEMFEFINYSEESLYSELWTLDVLQGQNIIRIAPESLSEVPDGDRLLTEIAATEVYVQDTDTPPTTVGKWYVDNLRIIEPAVSVEPGDVNGDGIVDLLDYEVFQGCLTGPGGSALPECAVLDSDVDGDIDLVDFSVFQVLFGGGQ